MKIDSTNFSNFHEQIANMKDHDEIVEFYIQYRNYLVFNDLQKALDIIKEGYYKYEKYQNEKYKYRLLLFWANTLVVLENFDEALEKMMKCIQYFQKKNDTNNLASTISNMATIFQRLEMFSYSVYLWKILLKKYIDPQNSYFVDVINCNVLMVNIVEFKKIDFSIEIIDDVIDRYQKMENIERKHLQVYLFMYSNKARYYKLLNNYKQAINLFEQLLIDYETHNFKLQKMDIYVELGSLYRLIDNEEKMIFCFKNVIRIGEEYNRKMVFSLVYKELYEYYKAKNEYKKAFNSLEKYNFYNEKKLEVKKNIVAIVKSIGIDNKILSNSNIKNIFNNDDINSDKFIFCENINGEIIKIDAVEIIYMQKMDENVVFFLSNNEKIDIKGNYRNLTAQLLSLFPDTLIFFEANARDTLFNLFWISRISIEDKIVYLRPYNNEIPISLSKRKWVEFKNILKI